MSNTAAPTLPAALRFVARPFVLTWLGLSVDGAENVPPTGPVLLAATHASHADALAIGAATPRPLTYLGSSHLPGYLRRIGMLPVDRGSGDAAALRRCMEALNAGAALVVFPEGGRSRDGRVYRPRSGVARLAGAAGCPVVPAGITGTAELWQPDHRPRLKPGAVRVRFGTPLAPPGPTAAARRAWNDELHQTLVKLSGLPAASELLPPAMVMN